MVNEPNPVLYVRVPRWLHDSIRAEAEERGETISVIVRQKLADAGMVRPPEDSEQ